MSECYTTIDMAFKYTALHLTDRRRLRSLEKLFMYMERNHGIVRQKLIGYSSINNTAERTGVKTNNIALHPGFKVIQKHFFERNPNFQTPYPGEGDPKFGLLLMYTGPSYLSDVEPVSNVVGSVCAGDSINVDEFDVVKKRKTIDAASESVGADVTSALLGGDEAAEYFHQFSSEVSNVA